LRDRPERDDGTGRDTEYGPDRSADQIAITIEQHVVFPPSDACDSTGRSASLQIAGPTGD
jgi:hypothetical protein